jgi:type II secretory pathway pseudopilin PulG
MYSYPKTSRNHAPARGAFTLVELLMVIGIITLLLAILLPSLGKAKAQSYVAHTRSLLSQLSAAITTYHSRFSAYPGPLNSGITTGTSKISGTQNLLLGLSYPMPSPPTWPFAVPTSPTGPIDYASQKPDGTYEQCAPFFTDKNIKTVTGATNNGYPSFPVIVDAFNDALPILYYRRTPGVNSSPVVSSAFNSGTSPSSYYYFENVEYTQSSTLQASTGQIYSQTSDGSNRVSLGATSSENPDCNLQKIVTDTGTAVRCNYVLISAGISRYYGSIKKVSDNIVQLGD